MEISIDFDASSLRHAFERLPQSSLERLLQLIDGDLSDSVFNVLISQCATTPRADGTHKIQVSLDLAHGAEVLSAA